ncbi:MAG TPA: delta-60 repeat domain-containing protein, partial [Polyangiaceae bacterium]|nr:delta-60 repeat domain-containing protein [Polyangiaceae bacterium]
MKKTSVKWLGGALAVCLGSSLVIACGDDVVDGDSSGGNGGADGSTGGADGSTGGQDGSTGGNDSVGGGGAGGDGPIQPEVPEASLITPKTARVVENMLNAYGSVFASDGKLYVAGATDSSALSVAQTTANLRLAVWRFNADGSPDTTFGTDGKVTSDIANPGTAYDIVEWENGKFAILISGGAASVAVVPFAAGAFGTPKTVAFGWDDPADFAIDLAAKIAAVDAACAPAKTACDLALPTAASGVCNTTGGAYDADACATQTATCATNTTTCQDEYPLAVAPNFSQRPGNYSSWGMALD